MQHAGDAAQLPGRAGGVLPAVDGQPGRRRRARAAAARVAARHAPAARPALRRLAQRAGQLPDAVCRLQSVHYGQLCHGYGLAD